MSEQESELETAGHTSAEDSADAQENQGEQSVKASDGPSADPVEVNHQNQETGTLTDRLRTKLSSVEALLEEREALLKKSVFEKINKAYAIRWREEANQFFQLAVMLRSRQRRLANPTSLRRDRIA